MAADAARLVVRRAAHVNGMKMGEIEIAGDLLSALRQSVAPAGASAKQALEWAEENRDWLWPDAGRRARLAWEDLPPVAEAGGQRLALADVADAVAGLLGLDAFDRRLLGIVVGLRRSRRLASLRTRLLGATENVAELAGIAAGAPAADALQRVHRSPVVTLGLVEIDLERSGAVDIDTSWRFDRVLDRGFGDPAALTELLVGKRQRATLARADFIEHAGAFDLLLRLLLGALAGREQGVNILIYGPPGTGKTELARTLADAAAAELFAVGEHDDNDDEPTRAERLGALRRAHRVLGPRGGSLLPFDELEDLLRSFSDDENNRQAGSKIFFNRLLETNPVPTIWTSNAIDLVDRAHLRRMSFVLKLDHPSPRAAARIVSAIAEGEGAASLAAPLATLAAHHPQAASVASVAVRAARIACADTGEARAIAESILTGLRDGRPLAPSNAAADLDLDLYESDPPMPRLIDSLAGQGGPSDFSVLLAGPPGTGKTALAAHLALRLDRPLLVRRVSDLLSKWVGETEANIAHAFAEALRMGAVLFFDEAESLLFDRSLASRGWEVAQVNELLTWMGDHPLPFVAATNCAARLDPASLRRFDFKLRLKPLSSERTARAFARFFGMEPPSGLDRVANLTPGDFAVVARQLRYMPASDGSAILRLLEVEANAKPGAPSRIGF